MAGASDHLFQISLAVTKGGFGFAAAFKNLFLELLLGKDRAHAAASAAPGSLEHQRITDLGGFFANGVHVVAQNLGCRNDRNIGGNGDFARAGLVAQFAHCFGFGADKGDAVCFAGVNKVRVFRQQAIPGVDGVGARHFGDADDFFNAQIGGNRAKSFADAIGFVRLETMQPEFVLFGKNGNGFLTHLVRRAHDADSNFAAVGNEDLGEFGQGGLLFAVAAISMKILQEGKQLSRGKCYR